MMPSTGTSTAVIRKLLLRPRTFVLRTRTNQNASSCTKLYCRVIPQTRMNQNKASSTSLYHRTIPQTCTNYVLRRKTNQNALLQGGGDAENEVTYDVPYKFNVSNVFECGRNNRDVSYERAYIATERDEYFTDMLDHLNKYNDCRSQRFSSKDIKEAVLRVMEE